MADTPVAEAPSPADGTYEILRRRLLTHGRSLGGRVDALNAARREVFGGVEMKLVGSDRVLTANNCVPRDMVALGPRMLFGYNVQLGLRREMTPSDVFALYEFQDGHLAEIPPEPLGDGEFVRDFSALYTYYKNTRFVKFALIGPHLFMVFRVGKDVKDVKCLKWLLQDDGTLRYLDNRSDHEYRYPPQHEFVWTRCTRDMQRSGLFPHISIEDRLFVETTGGDLTLKIEDNTASGAGIYSEPVDDPDQTLDDAEFHYARVGSLILLKIRPYREEAWRHIVYCEKTRQAQRVDAIAGACVLLPEDHGILFSNGYALQTGEHKAFDSAHTDMLFERRISSPNGEDTLYVFYNRDSGLYALLAYNLITQRVETPIDCHGFCLYADGRLMYFKTQDEPGKAHAVRIWQTPFGEEPHAAPAHRDGLLFKIGNRDIVRCMAGCRTLLGLLSREEGYTNLHYDITRLATELLDGYFWIREAGAGALAEPLEEIRAAASAAIGEYEKVSRLKNADALRLEEAAVETDRLLKELRAQKAEDVPGHVRALTALRALRGKVIALRGLRYGDDAAVDALEKRVVEAHDVRAQACVDFLLGDAAMRPYAERIAALAPRTASVETVARATELGKEVSSINDELELLLDVAGNLRIDDATARTRIIDGISALFTTLNQTRAALRNRSQSLAAAEGGAEFAAQVKLLGQAVINYLEVCDTPAKCGEYLSRLLVQVEELEGRFADFDEHVLQLAEKRSEIQNAFETRRLSLVEARNKRADTLLRSAERILNSVRVKVDTLKSGEEIQGYFASDLMAQKLRDIVGQLQELGDPVKAGDLETRLGNLREDALRQLRDRSDLFVGGGNLIQFGRHRFAVNTQPLELTVVPRGDERMLHLTGTNFFEAIRDPAFLATRDVWDQELVSENAGVYRSEFLAYQVLSGGGDFSDIPGRVRGFMAPRYSEGYQKGVHDEDAIAILAALLELRAKLGPLCVSPLDRALALVYWRSVEKDPARAALAPRLEGVGALNRAFRQKRRQPDALRELQARLEAFGRNTPWFAAASFDVSAEYLFDRIAEGDGHPASAEAGELVKGFLAQLRRLGVEKAFAESRTHLRDQPLAEFALLREWVLGHAESREESAGPEGVVEEAAALLFAEVFEGGRVAAQSARVRVEGLRGSHARLREGGMELEFHDFMRRLRAFGETTVPRYLECQRLKKQFLEETRREMRLDEFQARVLTSFVRNRLIDEVYLPLVGDNLAKQLGTAGEGAGDRMGMLMLISPPGYGKTTLMEYIANRLGIVFMKINGPAIGHRVTSLDPAEAPNAAAREELHKLGLALEMGDNVMLYLDDIQHCNPEFLQKFISLCDAQRKIEGVYKGRTRTYDFRGKKVAVVMAGNPYTESGEKFKIPDMLANRADTYNLGDILGDNPEAFELSFLENALTSNPALRRLASGPRSDIHALIRAASSASSDGLTLEGRHDPEEVSEMLSLLRKLIRVRSVVLRVNAEYIRSAGQSDDYRTEPAFRLQGSYRNMNRMASKLRAVMNDHEVESLIFSEYENEAQTLTTGAESNLLKLKELLGTQTEAEAKRWAEIKSVYARNQLLRGVSDNDPMGQAVAQLAGLGEGLRGIRDQLREAGGERTVAETALSAETLDRFEEMFREARAPLAAKAGAYDALLDKCRLWLTDFFVPLKEQSDGKPIARSIYLTDLERMINDIQHLLDLRGG